MPQPNRESDSARDFPDDAPSGPSAGSVLRRRRLLIALVAVAASVVAIDLVSKQLAIAALTGAAPVRIIDGLLSLRLVYNPGAAFSLASGATWIFTIIATVVVVVVVRVARRIGSALWAVALGLILGGAIGNLLDRLFRPPSFGQGHVVDFIDYAGFFVGNVADIAIVAAGALVIVLTILGIGVDGTVQGAGEGRRA